MKSTIISQWGVLVVLLVNEVVCQDFVILEPQTRTYNMNENITVRIYHEWGEEGKVEEFLEISNCTDYELGKGYISVEMTSVIHNLNGLAVLRYIWSRPVLLRPLDLTKKSSGKTK